MRIVKLYAEGCGPCKVLDKMLKDNNISYENISWKLAYCVSFDLSSSVSSGQSTKELMKLY